MRQKYTDIADQFNMVIEEFIEEGENSDDDFVDFRHMFHKMTRIVQYIDEVKRTTSQANRDELLSKCYVLMSRMNEPASNATRYAFHSVVRDPIPSVPRCVHCGNIIDPESNHITDTQCDVSPSGFHELDDGL